MKSLRQSRETWTRELAELICRRRGWVYLHASHTERFPVRTKKGRGYATRTYDLCGILDAIAFPREGGTVGIQFTSSHNLLERTKKVRTSEWLPVLLNAGWQILCWGFADNGELREERITSSGVVSTKTTTRRMP